MANSDLPDDIFRAIYERSAVGVVVLGKSGKILHANRKFFSIAGLKPDADGELTISSIIHEDDRDGLANRLGCIAVGARGSDSVEVRGAQSGWLWIKVFPVRYPSVDDSLVVGVIEDITNRKANEADLLAAKEHAEQTTRTKSDFLANMSHEIRTPLHAITGMTELLQETSLDAEQLEYTGQVSFSADVLLSLINDILDFSKIEAGQLSLESIEFDLYKTAEDSIDIVALEAHQKGLEVLLDIDQEVPRFVVGDPVRVRQVIINLCSNAMKFTRYGEIGIKIEAPHVDEDEAEVRITVRDTGIGIPKEKIDRLFKVFSQLDSSTTRKYGGSGLGLSICRNLVQMMGGTIGVESDPGRGSRFWFVLPFLKSERERLRQPPGNSFFESQRALVVDDNLGARYVIESYLREWGVDVESATDGRAALVALRNAARLARPFDFCLIDQFMPGIDGWHLASEINADSSVGDVSLFLMSPTGKTGDEAKMKLLNWFSGYINKPVKKGEFFDVLSRALVSAEELEPLEDDIAEEAESFSVAGISQPVLVAEDHEVNQQLFRTILQNLGIPVVVASDGVEAVKLAQKGVSMIFMDVQMPEMNGYEATEKIRSMGIEVPIIAVTASAVKGERERALEMGMTDFLTKPFKKNDLIPLLRKWLRPDAGAALSERSDAPREESGVHREVFDLDEAVDTFMGDREIVLQLLETLIEKTARSIDEIVEGFRDDDMQKIRSLAHAVKGSSQSLSAVRLGAAAESLENASRDGDGDGASAAFDSLKSRYDELLHYSRKITAG